MKLSLKKFFIGLLVFLVSAILIGFSIVVNIGLVGLPENFSYLIVFISIAVVTFYALSSTEKLIRSKGVLLLIFTAYLVLFLPKVLTSSLNFTLTSIPFFISFMLAMTGGYMHYKRRSIKWPLLMGAIPLILTLGLGSIWNSKIIYGSVSGEVQTTKVPDFNIVDKSGSVINNESIQGKIVVMDFWFISCPPCWVKFPELQQIYDRYKTNDRVAVYAVNHPMKNDKPNQLYTSVEKKNYTFPVAKGNDDMITAFSIDYYPTIIIIDPKGDIVFKGGIDEADKVINNLLN
jgi:cytochrome oxidase Cu insertion factor (SCO1/SenC/PrrC family)